MSELSPEKDFLGKKRITKEEIDAIVLDGTSLSFGTISSQVVEVYVHGVHYGTAYVYGGNNRRVFYEFKPDLDVYLVLKAKY